MSNLKPQTALKPSNQLPENVKKRNKTQRSIEMLMRKVMAHKICEAVTRQPFTTVKSTQNNTTITSNAPQSESLTIKAVKMELPLQSSLPTTEEPTSHTIRKHTNTKIVEVFPLSTSLSPSPAKPKKTSKSSRKTHIKIDSLVHKVLVDKTTENDQYWDDADNAIKALQLSNSLPNFGVKQNKMQRSIESLMMKIMARKLCEDSHVLKKPQTPTNEIMVIANAFKFPLNELGHVIKLEIKEEELLNDISEF